MINKFQESTLNIFYGYRCNFSCIGCCTGSDQIKTTARDPDINKTIEVLPTLASLIDIADGGMITLLGGEILMNWDEKIVPLAKALRQNFPGTTINLFTNGHLLHKYINEVISLMLTVGNCNLTISQHLSGDLDSTLGRKWTSNTTQFLNDSRIKKVHDNHYHIIDHIDCNIHFYNGGSWFTWYKQELDGLIKPHASKDPARSMKYGCASGANCSTIFETNLYKCSSLATLDGLLSSKDQIDDPDWQFYLDYPHVDLSNTNLENFEYHKKNYAKPVLFCDMCNSNPSNVITCLDRKQESILQTVQKIT